MRTFFFSIALQVPFATYPLGSPGSPADNKWQGSFLNSQTYTLNTQNVNVHSPMYVRNGTTYNPVNNLTNGTLLDKYQPFITTGPYNNQLCALPNLPGGGGNMPLALMKQVVQDSLPYSVFAVEAAWQNKKRVYEQLKQTPGLMNNEPILQNFFTTEQNNSIGQVPQVEEEIQTGNLLNAQSVNNTIIPYYIPDNNHKTFNEIYVDALLSNGIKNIDSLQLQAITQLATQCPAAGGEAIWLARTTLNTYYNDALVYYDSCQFNNNARVALDEENSVTKGRRSDRFNVKLYPNPNSGKMIAEFHFRDNEKVEFEIYNVAGSLVYKEIIKIDENRKEIKVNEIDAGLYFYRVYVDGQFYYCDKLVIIR